MNELEVREKSRFEPEKCPECGRELDRLLFLGISDEGLRVCGACGLAFVGGKRVARVIM